MNRPGNGTARRMITALLLVVIAFVGIAGCTTTRIKVTSMDREDARNAADTVNRGKYVGDDNITARNVPSCTTAPVNVDVCARDIAEHRAELNLGLGPKEKVFSLPKTAGLVGGMLFAVVILGGGLMVVRGDRPTLAGVVDKLPRGRRSGSSPSPTHPPAPTPRQPSAPIPRQQQQPSPSAPPQASSSGGYLPPRRASAPPPPAPATPTPRPPQATPQPPTVVTGEAVGYIPPSAAPAREPLRIPQSVKRGAAVTLAAVVVSVILGFVTPLGIIPWGVVIAGTLLVLLAVRAVLPNGFLAPRRVIIAMATFAATVLATFLVASCVVSIGTWIAGPPQPDWLHWLEWKGDVRLTWPAALILAITTTTLVMRKMVKRDRSQK